MEIEKEIPAWLSALIHAKFLKSKGNKESYLKYCCVDCASKSLTETQRKTEHQDHLVLEGYIASWHYGYEIEAIHKLMNYKDYDFVSGVAAFKINNILVYFQKSRAGPYPYDQYKNKCNGVGNVCVTCGWFLKDKPGCYCSILCKLLYEARACKPRFDALVRLLEEHQVGVVWPKKKAAQKREEEINGTGEKRRALVVTFKVGATSNGNEKLGNAQIGKLIEKKKNKQKKKAKKQQKRKDKKISKNKNGEKSALLVKFKLGVKGGGIKKPEIIKGSIKSANGFVGGDIMEQNTVLGGKISLLKRMEMEEQKILNAKAKKESKKRKRSPDSLEINSSNVAADQNSDKKLQSLIYVLNNCHKLQGFRKRARKGIPYRAPSH